MTILGSTGSIGRSTLALVKAAEAGTFKLEALVAGSNVPALIEQAKIFQPRQVVIANEEGYAALKEGLAGSGIEVSAGAAAVVAAASVPVDWTMAAIVGAAGLRSTIAALLRGGTIALANKESLVCGGSIVLAAARTGQATILPVDSEHNAIFQALTSADLRPVEKIILTASGGPFRNSTLTQMSQASPEHAIRHPVWAMGAKISVDSATMFNKGLELIEAARLFALPEQQIDVLIHPQSAVHGLVQYIDGSILAQLGSPDMRTPIAYCLAWPARMDVDVPRLDLAMLGRLEFEPPDLARFPALRIAREALRAEGGAPCILNAANEVAVELFLARRLPFLDIAAVVAETLSRMGNQEAADLEAVLLLDGSARKLAAQIAAVRAAA